VFATKKLQLIWIFSISKLVFKFGQIKFQPSLEREARERGRGAPSPLLGRDYGSPWARSFGARVRCFICSGERVSSMWLFSFKILPLLYPPPRPTDAVLSDRKERCGEGRERERVVSRQRELSGWASEFMCAWLFPLTCSPSWLLSWRFNKAFPYL
jgi:hypothetical protein